MGSRTFHIDWSVATYLGLSFHIVTLGIYVYMLFPIVLYIMMYVCTYIVVIISLDLFILLYGNHLKSFINSTIRSLQHDINIKTILYFKYMYIIFKAVVQ